MNEQAQAEQEDEELTRTMEADALIREAAQASIDSVGPSITVKVLNKLIMDIQEARLAAITASIRDQVRCLIGS